MDKNELVRSIAFAFDRHIRDSGTNLDPRSDSNKHRQLLMRFWQAMRAIEDKTDSYLDVEQTMRTILKERITFHDFKSEKKYVVYDEQGEKIEQ